MLCVCCAVLCCAVLCCAVLCCAVLCCAVLSFFEKCKSRVCQIPRTILRKYKNRFSESKKPVADLSKLKLASDGVKQKTVFLRRSAENMYTHVFRNLLMKTSRREGRYLLFLLHQTPPARTPMAHRRGLNVRYAAPGNPTQAPDGGSLGKPSGNHPKDTAGDFRPPGL